MVEKERVIDGKYILTKTLGKGATSKVYKAVVIKDNSKKIAIKKYLPTTNIRQTYLDFLTEVNLMKNLNHPNLINLIDANEKGELKENGNVLGNIMYLSIELAENAELFDFFAYPRKPFSEEIGRLIMKQTFLGLQSMKKAKICHRDLKMENMFLDDKYNVKIGDFGYAKVTKEENELLSSPRGTDGYQCPEIVHHKSYLGESADVFSCGVILFIMLGFRKPFNQAHQKDEMYRYFFENRIDRFWERHGYINKFSKELIELLTGMLNYKNRWTIEQVLESQWFKGPVVDEKTYIQEMETRKKAVNEIRKGEIRKITSFNPNTKIEGDLTRGGENEDENDKVLEILKNNNDFKNCVIQNWVDEDLPKYFVKCDNLKILENFKNFLVDIINDNEEVKFNFTNGKYQFKAEVPYSNNILEDNDENNEEEINETENISTMKLCFTATAYLDRKNNFTIIEIIKDKQTNLIDFLNYYTTVLKANTEE